MILHIHNIKTDLYRQGYDILRSKLTSVACPFSMYVMYIQYAKPTEFDDCSQIVLFRPIFRSGNTCKLIYKTSNLVTQEQRKILFLD
jgi:hypothetical protein